MIDADYRGLMAELRRYGRSLSRQFPLAELRADARTDVDRRLVEAVAAYGEACAQTEETK